MASGKAVAAECGNCGHEFANIVASKGRTTRRCAHCNARWPELDADAIKGEVKLKRRLRDLDAKQAELAGLARAFALPPEHRTSPPVDLEAWSVVLGMWALKAVGEQSYERIAQDYGADLSRLGRGSGRDSVRRLIGVARRVVAERLGLAGGP